MPIGKGAFGDWLGWLLFEDNRQTCSDQTLEPALRVLRAKAKFEGPCYHLSNRVAWMEDGAIYYDMTNEQWSAIRVTCDGWEVNPVPPILFRRYSHHMPQVMPAEIAPQDAWAVLNNLFKFVNLGGDDNRLLYIVYLVSLLVPDIAHPIPVIHGEQGCGKTFTLKTTRKLVDPSLVGVLATPWKPEEFVQQLDHHWCAFYDNLKKLTEWQQDTLCRAVTGEGNTKRQLYTDQDDIVFTYRRCIALNGINVCSKRPDLLDRSILFELDALNSNRRTESELETEFEQVRPQLFGALLTMLVGALNQSKQMAYQQGKWFRLADWASWGWRIAEALDGRGNDFIACYNNATKTKAETALELHPLGQVLIAFMKGKDYWEGTPSKLHSELEQTALLEELDTSDKGWPSNENWLGRRLREIAPDLSIMGITYTYEKGEERTYRLFKQ